MHAHIIYVYKLFMYNMHIICTVLLAMYVYIYVTLSHLRSKEIPVYIYDIALAVEC